MADRLFLGAVANGRVVSGATAGATGTGRLVTPLPATLEAPAAITVAARPLIVPAAVRSVQPRQWMDRAVLSRFVRA